MLGAPQIPYVPPQPDPRAPSVLYPPWMDPLYLLHTTRSITTRMQCDATGLLRIGANPARWSITICLGSGSATPRVSIHRTSAVGGFGVYVISNSAATSFATLTLFDYGADVPSELYVRAGASEFLEVTERVIYNGVPDDASAVQTGAGWNALEDRASDDAGSGGGRNDDGGARPQGALHTDSVGALGGVGGTRYVGGDNRG